MVTLHMHTVALKSSDFLLPLRCGRSSAWAVQDCDKLPATSIALPEMYQPPVTHTLGTVATHRLVSSCMAMQVRGLEGEIRGVKEDCDKLLSQQRHLQSKLHALEEELGRIHSKVTPESPDHSAVSGAPQCFRICNMSFLGASNRKACSTPWMMSPTAGSPR